MSTCNTCKHVHHAGGKPGCRRFPPQVSYIIVPKPSTVLGGGLVPSEESRSAFPTVRPDWSCGEWAARLEMTS
jgi:hypothetical protein